MQNVDIQTASGQSIPTTFQYNTNRMQQYNPTVSKYSDHNTGKYAITYTLVKNEWPASGAQHTHHTVRTSLHTPASFTTTKQLCTLFAAHCQAQALKRAVLAKLCMHGRHNEPDPPHRKAEQPTEGARALDLLFRKE
jgi:hypothetical protein